MARILVVDDDEGVRSFVAEALELGNHQVTAAGSPEEAVTHLHTQRYDLLITDLQMPGVGGMALLAQARTGWPRMGTMVLTAHGTADNALSAFKLGVHGFVKKPVQSPAMLRELVVRALIRATLTP